MTTLRTLFLLLSLAIFAFGNVAAQSVGSAFTYQGELQDAGGPANGSFDLEFRLFDVETGGVDVVPEASFDGVAVNNGIFSVDLDFGDAPFDGSALWLEIRVRQSGGTGMTILEPRQPISATPYALQALMVDVDSISSVNIVNNSIIASDIAADAVRASEIAPAAVEADAISLPMFLQSANDGNTDILQSAILAVVNSAPSTPSNTESPYGVIGSVEYSSGTVSPVFLPPAGVLGSADAPGGTGVGVIGVSGGFEFTAKPSRAGVLGISAEASGVFGSSGDSTGVRGNSRESFGVQGVSTNSIGGDFSGRTGLRARSTAALNYGAEFTSDQYRGMFAESDVGFFDGYFGQGAGISTTAVTSRGAGAKALAINLGDQPIRSGDLVALAGVEVNPETGDPVLGVALVNDANAHGVVGVGDSAVLLSEQKRASGGIRYDFAPTDGAAYAGDYLIIVTSGLAARVNLPGLEKSGLPAIGEKLSINASGQVQKFLGAAREVVIGKVAGEMDPETATFPVYLDID